MKLSWLLGFVLVACTKPNPAVCCLDEADCKANGFHEVRMCAVGLACVDHQCVVPSCSMTGCAAEAPVCNITTDVCEGCTDASHCSRFADTDVCDTETGACVECVTAADCDPAEPVCDASACRACKLDSECPSGACGDDGACVPESAIVYMDPRGTDAGDCSRSAPCRSFEYAVTRTATSRPHIVMNPGAYVEVEASIQPQSTSAPQLFIHGSGATLSQASGADGVLLDIKMSVTIRDLDIFNSGTIALGDNGAVVLAERLRIQARGGGVTTGGTIVIRDTTIEGSAYAVQPTSGSLTLERVVIRDAYHGVYGGNATVYITSSLIYRTSDRAIELPSASGMIVSSTIADSGTDSGTGPRAVRCSSAMTVRSSIIWAPGTTSRVPIEGCNLVATIAGPTATPGAMNVDPQFVDSANGDYHIAQSSPARDAVDSGPETDFEGEPRPQGARFDIGADEAAP